MVYVVQDQPAKNLLPAQDYGKLKFMLPVITSQLNVQDSVEKIRSELADFQHDDYLLPIGDPVLIGAAVAIAGKKTGGSVRCLKWDKQERRYYEVSVTI